MTDEKKSKRGLRVTWPMVLGWLVTAAAVVPVVLPELAGAPEWLKRSLTIFAIVVSALNHSPLPTPGGVKP